MGNFLRSGFHKSKFLNYRRRNDIRFVDNLTIHKKPLRFAKSPLKQRKIGILKTSEKNLRSYIRREGKPDVIFHHGIFDYVYMSKYLSETFGIPVWYMENSPNLKPGHFPCANPFDSIESRKIFVKNAQRRIAVTKAYVEKMEKLFSAPFELIPNVLTDDFFVSDPKPRPSNPFTFSNVAILDSRKRQDLIIDAFAEAFGGNEHFQLVIAGDGKLEAELREHVKRLKLDSQVQIAGFLNRDEVKKLLDSSHAFVLASKAETFGVVVIEAMARGIPAISSDIDGTREIFNTINGILFQEGNKVALVNALKELVANYDIYDPKKIVEHVKSRFGPDAVKKGLYRE